MQNASFSLPAQAAITPACLHTVLYSILQVFHARDHDRGSVENLGHQKERKPLQNAFHPDQQQERRHAPAWAGGESRSVRNKSTLRP